MSPHLPRPDLAWLIRQRHRVLRGRDLTTWEIFRERLPYVDWFDVAFLIMVLSMSAALIAVAIAVLQ